MSITGSSSIHRLKGVALLPRIADRRRGDGRPRRVIWGEDPVIAVPVFSGRRDEIGEPVQLVFRLQGHPWPLPPWAVAAKATGWPDCRTGILPRQQACSIVCYPLGVLTHCTWRHCGYPIFFWHALAVHFSGRSVVSDDRRLRGGDHLGWPNHQFPDDPTARALEAVVQRSRPVVSRWHRDRRAADAAGGLDAASRLPCGVHAAARCPRGPEQAVPVGSRACEHPG